MLPKTLGVKGLGSCRGSQRLTTENYQEMAVDLFVSNEQIYVTNTHQLLFAEERWVTHPSYASIVS